VSRAVQCEVCGGLTTPDDAIALNVTGPENVEGNHEGWSDVEVCRACLAKPLGEVLSVALEGWPPDPWKQAPTAEKSS
jgi:hypothetical protein